MFLILLGSIITIFLLFWALSSPFYWKHKGVAYFIPLPLFGSNLATFKMSLAEFFQKLYQTYPDEKFVGYHFFMKPTLLMRDPSVIKDICIKDFEYFTRNGMYSNEDHDPFGSNLLFIYGQAWKEIRTKLSTLFTPLKLRYMDDFVDKTIIKVNQLFNEKISKNEPIEIDKISVKIATNIIIQSLFGIETDCFDEKSLFIEKGKNLFTPSTNARVILGLIAPDLCDLLRVNTFSKKLTKFLGDVLKDVFKYREKNPSMNQDFITMMMQLMEAGKDENIKKYYEDNTRVPEYNFKTALAQALILYAGGAESSAMTMAFFLYEASLNQEIQEKCRAEIMSVVNETGSDIKADDIGRLTYLDMALKEAVRKYPSFITMSRKCTKKYTFRDTNLTIEPGTLLIIPIKSIQWDPKNFPNPEAFIPERFADKTTSDAYLSWGLGPRTCLGKNFARMQMMLTVARLFRKYHFRISPKTEVPLKFCPNTIVTTPNPGIWLDVQPINA